MSIWISVNSAERKKEAGGRGEKVLRDGNLSLICKTEWQ